MIAQGYKEVEEELGASVEHFQLHRTAPLERAAAADNESEIVGPQLGIRVGSVGIRISCRGEDGTALDPRFCSVLV